MFGIDQIRSKAFRNSITILTLVILFVSSAECVNVTFVGNASGHFKPNQNIEITWVMQKLPFDYKPIEISVKDLKNQNVFSTEGKVLLKTQDYIIDGDNRGDINWGRLQPGGYYVLIRADPMDPNDPPISDLRPFDVADRSIVIEKYNDLNGNGRFDSGENWVSGWEFSWGKAGGPLTKYEAATGADGKLVIPITESGTYTIKEESQSGWYNTTDLTQQVYVGDGPTPVEFGNIPAGYLKITSFADLNGDGSMEGSDYPVAGWNFVVAGNGLNMPVTTGNDGTNTIALKPGQYSVTELHNACWTATGETTKTVTVTPMGTSPVLFGNKPQSNITISAFEDTNKNGMYDTGESSISGVSFAVIGPQGTQNLTSGRTGSVKFAGIPGTYTIASTVAEGWTVTSPNPQTDNVSVCEDKQVLVGVAPIPIMIEGVYPNDNEVLGSRNVTFSWITSENSSSKLYLKQENETKYGTPLRGQDGIIHSINIPNLARNTKYNFKVRSEKGTRSSESETRSFSIDNGIIFDPNTYNLTVERDYDQHRPIYVKNTDSKPHSIKVNITNYTYSDVYVGFLGVGSIDRELNLAPGETKSLDLVINAQDAMQKNYAFIAKLTNLGPEKIVDYARINVNVHPNITDFKFEEIALDPINLTKTFRVTNLQDPIRDLTVTPDANLGKDVVIQPYINHASLGTGGSIEFTVSPMWSKNIEAISGFLNASAGATNKVLPVNFSCQEGRKLYQVTLYNPLLHFDTNIYQCINAISPIEGSFLLPPGLTSSNVSDAKFSMELNARDGSQTPYDVWVTINGNEVRRIKKDMLFTNYEFAINSSNLRYSIAGSAPNKYSINDTMPNQYLTIISNVKVVMCLDKLELFICAENPQQAESIAGRIPWIYQPSRRLNVSILQPENGANLTFGADTTIKARVMGNGIGEKYATVIARFNNSRTIRTLVNNGEYEAGVYATNWIPDAYGPCTITVIASNCVTIGSAKFSAMVPRVPDTGGNLFVGKDLVPATLETNNIDTVNGSRMKYTISLIPIGGTSLTDVTVKDNIPNYIDVDNSTLRDRAIVKLNHDGMDWSTTNITWAIGDMHGPRKLSFDGVFHWRLPADAQYIPGSPLTTSVVTYTNAKGQRQSVEIPEEEIKIAGRSSSATPSVPSSGPETPGFEAILGLTGLVASYLMLRKR